MISQLAIYESFPVLIKGCYIECGSGWNQIIKDCLDQLEYLRVTFYPKLKVFEIKEKFGGLRVSLNDYPAEVDAIIRRAEHRALSTCEECGLEGKPYSQRGWVKTLCTECRRKFEIA